MNILVGLPPVALIFARMFKRCSILFFLLFSPFLFFGQQPGNPNSHGKGLTGFISGSLVDSITSAPIEFATVGIVDDITGKVINGSLADERGSFRIGGMPEGQYTLQISFIGYATKTISGIQLTPKRPDYNAGTIILAAQSQLLDEIKVLGEAALIEAKPDRIVYNAEKDVTTRGGDAADVLRKVPMLAVDLDGNVSMRGSENVKILINGRPSSMFNSNIADALKMMPADQIKAVEVITAPSAKYDAEGTAGIINIITKKKNIEGLTGTVDGTVGTRNNRGNANLNYGRGRLGINASGGGHYGYPQDGTTSLFREENNLSDSTLLKQDGTTTTSRYGYRTNVGIEYDANAFNIFNGSVSYRGGHNINNNDVLSVYQENESLVDSYLRQQAAESDRHGWEWGIDFKHLFPKKDREWTFSADLDLDDDLSNADYDVSYYFPVNQPATLDNNINKGTNQEWSLQTDYSHPFNDHLKIETGLKASLRNIESAFTYRQFDQDVMSWFIDPERTDIFYYDQHVLAGYVSTTAKIGEKTNLIAGLRAEATDLHGSFAFFTSPFNNAYTNWLPSITISRSIGQLNQIRVSYNQRIQRPNQRQLNPFVEYNDNRDISYGNPYLAPEYVHQIEIAGNFFMKGNMLSLSVYGRQTDDLIESLLRINEDGISETTYENFGIRSAIGLNLFGTVLVGKKLALRGGADVNLWKEEGQLENEDLSNTGSDISGRINLTWTISETIKAEGFTFFRSPTYTVQGKTPSWSMMSVGVKKELFNRRFTVGLNITEPFRENQSFIRELSGPDFYQYSKNVRPVRSFGISLGYRFGKLDFNERDRKKDSNDMNNDFQGNDNQNRG
jgi:ferric enterobactin receptor